MTVNTTGTSNVAVGPLSMDANTTGYSNIAIGRNALGTNITGNLSSCPKTFADVSIFETSTRDLGLKARVSNASLFLLNVVSDSEPPDKYPHGPCARLCLAASTIS